MTPAGGLLIRATVAAELLGVNVRVVRALVRSGELPGRHLRGRWYVLRCGLEALSGLDAGAQ